MQIQAGQYKGRRIKTVKNAPYRPTTSLVRKSLFDILGDVSGKTVLDLFAGSGIVGFEAASRGAESVTFVESSMRVNALLKMNGAQFKETELNYIRKDVVQFLNISDNYDIIFSDPPYNIEKIESFITLGISHLNEDGIFILESSKREFSISHYRVREYGDTQLTFWRNK